MHTHQEHSSLNYEDSRYRKGGSVEEHHGKLGFWERANMIQDGSDTWIRLDSSLVNNPRRISLTAYGTEAYWWLICQYNGVLDPLSELTEGTMLRIPAFERLGTIFEKGKHG